MYEYDFIFIGKLSFRRKNENLFNDWQTTVEQNQIHIVMENEGKIFSPKQKEDIKK